jgi:hypothetical protein
MGSSRRLGARSRRQTRRRIARRVGKPAEFAVYIAAPVCSAKLGDYGGVSERNGKTLFLRTPETLFG